MNQPPRFLSKKDFAAHRGVGKSAVSNWVAKGWVVEAEDPADGVVKVDVKRTELKLAANLDPVRGRPKAADAEPAATEAQPELPRASAPQAPVDSVASVRTDLMRQQITAAAMKNAQAAGELVRLEDHARITGELGRLSRERMHALVRTHAEWLASAKDPRGIVAFLGEEIDRVYSDLAAQAKAGELVDLADEETADELAEVEAALAEPEEEHLEAG